MSKIACPCGGACCQENIEQHQAHSKSVGVLPPIPVQVSRRAGETLALKVQNPGSAWEFYISRVLQGRLPDELRAGFGCAQQLLMLEGGAAALLMPLGAHGNLQDLLNAHLSQGRVGDAGRASPATRNH